MLVRDSASYEDLESSGIDHDQTTPIRFERVRKCSGLTSLMKLVTKASHSHIRAVTVSSVSTEIIHPRDMALSERSPIERRRKRVLKNR
jgi:hypothetical protein